MRPDSSAFSTEESTVARFGSSLGWLLQLDGDNLRNAFLNAPWVKAVIPIRPGREKAALNWLRAIEGHEQDGWDTTYSAWLDSPDVAQGIQRMLQAIVARMSDPANPRGCLLTNTTLAAIGGSGRIEAKVAGAISAAPATRRPSRPPHRSHATHSFLTAGLARRMG